MSLFDKTRLNLSIRKKVKGGGEGLFKCNSPVKIFVKEKKTFMRATLLARSKYV